MNAPSVGEIRITPAQAEVIAAWSEQGESFLPLVLHAVSPTYACDWTDGDVLVTQGDAYLHVGSAGVVKDVVPPSLIGLG
jgi:hypothetical protein